MNQLDYIVFDLETGGVCTKTDEILQCAAQAYDARTLEPYSEADGGSFNVYMQPKDPDNVKPQALAVNGLSLKFLEENGVEAGVGWKQFIEWTARWKKKGGILGLPIVGGKNIRRFDLKFVERYNGMYSPKGGKTKLFAEKFQLELEDILFYWFENDAEIESIKMDVLRPYFGMSTKGAHNAVVDVKQTGALLMRFLKLHRELRSRKGRDGNELIKFKGSMKGV